MQKIRDDKHRGFKGGRYARTEEDLHKKAIALLDKCRIEPQQASKGKARTA